jgi:TBC1 domain family protein 5
MFKWKHEIEQEEKDRRAKIEKIYDDERKKSAVMRRCNKIYHNFLKRVDTDVYKHLTQVGLDPELQLMRWLRCILSREFNIDIVLALWDYIFVGIQDHHRVDRDFGDMYYTDSYFETKDDPLINLDFLCLAMIENIRDRIYKKDVEDCLEVFFHYPPISGASRLISISGKIETAVKKGEA